MRGPAPRLRTVPSAQPPPAGDARLTRERGAPILTALGERMPAALERSQVAGQLADALVGRLRPPPDHGELIVEAARHADIGKLYVRGELLRRPLGRLTPNERAEYDHHFRAGHDLAIGAGLSREVATWILHARARWDGQGPGGLHGEQIPLGARVMAVTREYLDAPVLAGGGPAADPRAQGVSRLRAEAGTTLDPDLGTLAATLASPGSGG
jgi:HD-GYP domain-containing protein (c-di-GMP phosphodiesterase class II)